MAFQWVCAGAGGDVLGPMACHGEGGGSSGGVAGFRPVDLHLAGLEAGESSLYLIGADGGTDAVAQGAVTQVT